MGTVTNPAGRFLFPMTPAGSYALTVEQPGFEKLEKKGITIGGLERKALGELAMSRASGDAAKAKPGPPETGIAIRKPVFAGACRYCPWGVIAYEVRQQMKPYDLDVQVCYVCAQTMSPQQVGGAYAPDSRKRPASVTAAANNPADAPEWVRNLPVPRGPADLAPPAYKI